MFFGTLLSHASDYRSDPIELRDGPDGTIDVRYSAFHAARYARDGAVVALPAVWPVSERVQLLVSGGGNQATVGPTGLVVTGARPCEVPLTPGAEADRELRLAVSASHAALTNAEGALLVDLARCAPVATRSGAGWRAPGTIGFGSWGLVALTGGFGVTWWEVPSLRIAGGFDNALLDVVDGGDGPLLVLQDRLLGARRGRPLQVETIGGMALGVDAEGRLHHVDRRGASLAVAPDDALADAVAVAGEGRRWVLVPRPALQVRRGDGAPEPGVRVDGTWLDWDRTLFPPNPQAFAEPAVGATVFDPCVLQREGPAVVVTCGADRRGVPVPTTARVVRADPRGRVVVSLELEPSGQWVVARAVADAATLWRVGTDRGASALVVGTDWLAVRSRGSWDFLSPSDGASIAHVGSGTTMRVGRVDQPLDVATLRGGPWRVPEPTDSPWTPTIDPVAFAMAVAVGGCAGAERVIARMAPWPAVQQPLREGAAWMCPPEPAVEAPRWPDVARPEPDGWAWTAPEPLTEIGALAGGLLLVESATTVGVLGPDGALRWSRPHENASPAGDLVLLSTGATVTARDATTGTVRWTKIGHVAWDGTAPRWSPLGGMEARILDPRTGLALPAYPPSGHRVLGWTCTGGACTRDLAPSPPAPEPDPSVQGGPAWRLVGATVEGRGLPSPTPSAAPLRAELAPDLRAQVPFPRPGLVREASRPTDGPTLQETGRRVCLVSGGEVRWTLADRVAIGVLGDVAVVARRGSGTWEGHAVESGETLWAIEGTTGIRLGGGALWSSVDDRTVLYDPRSGSPVRSWPRKAILASDGRRVVAAEVSPLPWLRDEGDVAFARLTGKPLQLAVDGELVVATQWDAALSAEVIVAFRGEAFAWRHTLRDARGLRLTREAVIVQSRRWTFALDRNTGALLDAEMASP